MAGEGEGGSGEVRADYDIRRGERVEIYEVRDGRARRVKRAAASGQTGVG
jgi:hypothetical protein